MNKTNGYLPIGDCFPSVYNFHKVRVEDTVSRLHLSIKTESVWSSLNEIVIKIGRKSPSYDAYDLTQDSARTWLVLDDDQIKVNEIQLRGNADLAFTSNTSSLKTVTFGKLVGDHTGTLHAAKRQRMVLQSFPNSIVAASIFAYQVSISILFPMYWESLGVIFDCLHG